MMILDVQNKFPSLWHVNRVSLEIGGEGSLDWPSERRNKGARKTRDRERELPGECGAAFQLRYLTTMQRCLDVLYAAFFSIVFPAACFL